MFMVVMHQSVDMADNMDYDGMTMSAPPPPPPAHHLPEDQEEYPVSLLLVLILSKVRARVCRRGHCEGGVQNDDT